MLQNVLLFKKYTYLICHFENCTVTFLRRPTAKSESLVSLARLSLTLPINVGCDFASLHNRLYCVSVESGLLGFLLL